MSGQLRQGRQHAPIDDGICVHAADFGMLWARAIGDQGIGKQGNRRGRATGRDGVMPAALPARQRPDAVSTSARRARDRIAGRGASRLISRMFDPIAKFRIFDNFGCRCEITSR
jgi:hypothetical protein